MKHQKLNPHLKISDTTTLLDFWQWAYSDIMNNRNRAILAEFLVGTALGCLNETRIEWDSYDLVYKGKRIEVKSSAYIQSWHQEKTSKIIFDISKKDPWDPATNTYSGIIGRNSDIYVFCLLSEKDTLKVNPLNVDQWQFIIAATSEINDNYGDQKTVTLSRLIKNYGLISFPTLKENVDNIL